MARIGRTSVLVCLALFLPISSRAADPPADPQAAVVSALAIQDAMRQGRECLQRGQPKAAVDALEAQLPRINGNPTYLGLLREAYAAYVKDLEFAHDDDLCAAYQKRLQILDKSVPAPRPTPASAPARTAVQNSQPGDDPMQQTPRRGSATDIGVLPEAEKAFAEKRYAEADDLFAKAFPADAADSLHAQQWAYCKLSTVVARLKDAEAARTPIAAGELEREVTAALKLAAEDAQLATFCKQVMEAVRQRGSATAAPVTVRHQERGTDGWARAESTNFKLMHNHPRAFAEQVVKAAEAARTAAVEKWSGNKAAEWKPVCEMFLYATAADYAKATGKPADSPGHATYKAQNGVIVSRRLDLRSDDPNLLATVVPHETTHLVLGDLFAEAPLPRWADEGMAVLAEPKSRCDQFTRTLYSNRRQGRLVPLDRLFGKDDYPDAALITVFYVESVSVVDFLVAEKGPQTFVQFLRDVSKSGLEAALRKHYDCRSVAMLEERWRTKMFSGADVRAAGGQ